MTTRAKVVLGICGAVVAGVVITLLVAPEQSKEVGKRIKKSTGKWVDKLGNIFTSVAEEHVDNIREKTKQVRNMING